MKKKHWLILLVAVDILLVIVIAGSIYMQTQFTPQKEESALPEESQLASITQGMSYVTYAAEAVGKDGKIAIWLSNGEESPYSIRAEIILPQTDTIIAHTDWIEPGYRLEYMNADQHLSEGKYPCLMRIELATMQGKSIGKAGRSLLLNVQ